MASRRARCMSGHAGEFVDSGSHHLESAETDDVLAEFLTGILQRIEGLSDERIEELKENWRAIRGADADEAKFCIASGRMGVDP